MITDFSGKTITVKNKNDTEEYTYTLNNDTTYIFNNLKYGNEYIVTIDELTNNAYVFEKPEREIIIKQEYEKVELQYFYTKVYLFKDGVSTGILNWENYPKTGSYQTLVSPSQKSNYILFSVPTEYTISGYTSSTKMDLTPYKKISWNAQRNITRASTGGELYIGPVKDTYNNRASVLYIGTERKIYELDISELNDSYYLSPLLIQAAKMGEGDLYLYSYELWLEK